MLGRALSPALSNTCRNGNSGDLSTPKVRSGIASLNPMDPVLVVHGTRRVSRSAVDSSLSEDHLRAIDSFLAPA